jgi:hypothetical protein
MKKWKELEKAAEAAHFAAVDAWAAAHAAQSLADEALAAYIAALVAATGGE